jgi:hypothetical protein
MVLLSKLEEAVVVNDGRFELSTNRYPGVLHPRGLQYLVNFRLDPFPVREQSPWKTIWDVWSRRELVDCPFESNFQRRNQISDWGSDHAGGLGRVLPLCRREAGSRLLQLRPNIFPTNQNPPYTKVVLRPALVMLQVRGDEPI